MIVVKVTQPILNVKVITNEAFISMASSDELTITFFKMNYLVLEFEDIFTCYCLYIGDSQITISIAPTFAFEIHSHIQHYLETSFFTWVSCTMLVFVLSTFQNVI